MKNNFNVKKIYKTYNKIFKLILFTVFFILLFKLCSFVKIPNIKLSDYSKNNLFTNTFLLFGGGINQKFSLVSLGVSPYITASIVFNVLFSGLFPKLIKNLRNSKNGNVKIEFIIRILAIPISLIQGFLLLTAASKNPFMLEGNSIFETKNIIIISFMFILGTFITIFISNLITNYGIGSGVSILIFSNIAFSFLQNIYNLLKTLVGVSYFLKYVKVLLYIFLIIGFIFFIIFFESAKRKIPIQQIGQGLNVSNSKKVSSELPFKLNSSGILPIFFSVMLLGVFNMVGNFGFLKGTKFQKWTAKNLKQNSYIFLLIQSAFVVVFTFIYSHIQVNCSDFAEHFQKSGTYIPSIKPGSQTIIYLQKIINRLNILAILYLLFIIWFPFFLNKVLLKNTQNNSFVFSGTSLLIMSTISIEISNKLMVLLKENKLKVLKNENKTSSFLW